MVSHFIYFLLKFWTLDQGAPRAGVLSAFWAWKKKMIAIVNRRDKMQLHQEEFNYAF